MKTFLLLFYCIFSFSALYAQNPDWINYTTSNSPLPVSSINSIAIDNSGNKWIGTRSGLAKFDGTTWTVYTSSNSGLPISDVLSITVDGSGNKWIGTGGGGFAKYDGTTWTVYNTSNSPLPYNVINPIAIDNSGNKWIGTNNYLSDPEVGRIAEFDGLNWAVSGSFLSLRCIISIAIDISGNKWIGTKGGGLLKVRNMDTTWFYTSSNSGLPTNDVKSITVDGSDNKWIGTSVGLAKFDGTTWTIYNTSNSGLPDNLVPSIAIDSSGNKWIGTLGGLAKFDGTTWTVYTTSNSGLPDNYVFSIAIDGSGNKWIGTDGGLAVYKEGGVVTSVKEKTNKNIPEEFTLFQNYPNPFNPSTVISYQIASAGKVSLKVYDMLGREVATLVNETKSAGNYTATFNATKLPSGVYFYRLQAGTYSNTKKLLLLK